MSQMLKKYFENKIGEKIIKEYITGINDFSAIYQRNYELEVIGVQNGDVYFYIKSYDVTPTGYSKDGTNNNFGTIFVKITGTKLEDIIDKATLKADLDFFERYRNRIIN